MFTSMEITSWVDDFVHAILGKLIFKRKIVHLILLEVGQSSKVNHKIRNRLCDL